MKKGNSFFKFAALPALFLGAAFVAEGAFPKTFKHDALAGAKTFCNPLNINYRPYHNNARTAADPVIVPFKGKYYLFSSIYKGGVPGYRVSDDLISWKPVKFPESVLPKILDAKGEQMAPAVFAMDGYVYWSGLGSRVVIRSANPADGDSWEVYSERALPGFDPCYFLDDDGKIYDYFGGHENVVARLNPKDFTEVPKTKVQLTPKTKGAETLINSPYGLHQGKAEYETRYSDWNKPETLDTTRLIRRNPPQKPQFSTVSEDSMQEAAWLTKYNGKYYLQNSNPGTACPWYSDSVYVSDYPDKDFKLADYATASLKVGGFINSTGHSCVFQDFNGNWWRVTTMWVGVHAGFERRLGLFPVGFDDQGRMFTQTYLGDYPMAMPAKKVPFGTPLVKWDNLISPAKAVAAASSIIDEKYSPNLAADENVRTWWCAKTGDAGEWLEVEFSKTPRKLCAVQVNFAEHGIDQSANDEDYHAYKLFYKSSPDSDWKILVDKSQNKTCVPHDYVELKTPVQACALRLENVHAAKRGKFAVRDLRAFGFANIDKPKPVSNASAVRDESDKRNIRFFWKGGDAQNVCGYIINYGVSPDALHLSVQYQKPDAESLTLSCFNSEAKDYWFRIDAYNEGGVAKGEVKKVSLGKLKLD